MTAITSHAESAARSALRNVSPSTVAAMRALDYSEPDTLRGLITAVLVATAGDSPDVSEHAVMIAAEVYAGVPGEGAARTLHAARRARSLASRTVALAADEDLYGTAEECAVLLEGETAEASAVAMPETVPADRSARVTFSDLTETVAGTLDSGPAIGLRRAMADYRRHATGDCGAGEACANRPGRRVTLTGVTAHLQGWEQTDSRYHSAYRATRSALRAVTRTGTDHNGYPAALGYGTPATEEGPAWGAWNALAAIVGDPAPLATRTHGRNSTSGADRTPGTLAVPYSTLRHARSTMVTVRDAETVRTPGRDALPAESSERGEWARSAIALDREIRAMGRNWTDENGYPLGHGYGLDVLGYGAWLGYADPAATVAVLQAERRCLAAERADRNPVPARVVTVAHYRTERVTLPGAGLPFPTLDALEHNGTARYLTDAERETVRKPRTGSKAPAPVLPALDADTAGTAPMRDTRRDGGAIRPRPRKGARSGQTGPTVPVRLSR